MDDDLKATLTSIGDKIDKTHTRIDDLGKTVSGLDKTVAVVSTKFEGLEERVVKVETRPMPSAHPKKDNDLSTRQILAIVGGIVALLGGGGGLVVTQQVKDAKADVVQHASEQEEIQREAMAALLKAMARSQEAQSAGVEAAVSLDEHKAEKAKAAAREAALEALRAEKVLRRESAVVEVGP